MESFSEEYVTELARKTNVNPERIREIESEILLKVNNLWRAAEAINKNTTVTKKKLIKALHREGYVLV
jgi:DNA-directed RNA polymerase sigma subunit (sigma70/sigma32)